MISHNERFSIITINSWFIVRHIFLHGVWFLRFLFLGDSAKTICFFNSGPNLLVIFLEMILQLEYNKY